MLRNEWPSTYRDHGFEGKKPKSPWLKEMEQGWAEKEPGLPEEVMTQMRAEGQRDKGGNRVKAMEELLRHKEQYGLSRGSKESQGRINEMRLGKRAGLHTSDNTQTAVFTKK